MAGLIGAGLFARTPASLISGDLLFEALVMAVSVGWLVRDGLFAFGATAVEDVRDLVRRGWPTMGVGVGILLIFRADRYVIGAFAGASAVTLYSTAATLAEATRTIPHALGQVFMRHIAERSPVSLRRTLRAAVLATLGTGALVAVVGWVAMPVVFGHQLHHAAEVHDARDYLLLLLGAEVLFCPFFVASRGLVGGGWTRDTGVIGGVGCVAAVASYLALVPGLGVTGACIASAATYLGLSLATVGRLERRLAERAREVASRHDQAGSGHDGPHAVVDDPLLAPSPFGDGPVNA